MMMECEVITALSLCKSQWIFLSLRLDPPLTTSPGKSWIVLESVLVLEKHPGKLVD